MRVPVYDRQASLAPLQGGQVNPVIPAGDNGAAMAGMANQFMLRLQKMNDDFEDAHTLELLNKLKQDSTDYHENPEKGIYNTQLGYKAQGTYQDADRWLRERGEHYAMQIKGERAKANFRRMAGEYIQQRGVQNSKFEAEQMKKFRLEQADASMKNALEFAEKNWNNPQAIEQARSDIAAALELKLRGSGQEAFKSAWADIENQLGIVRLRQAYALNPLLAVRMLNDSDIKLNPETRAKLTRQFSDKTEVYRIQAYASQYARLFNKENMQAAYQRIIQSHGADEGGKIFQQVNYLWNIADSQEAAREQQKNKFQSQEAMRLFGLINRGYYPTNDEINSSGASEQAKHQFIGMRKSYEAEIKRGEEAQRNAQREAGNTFLRINALNNNFALSNEELADGVKKGLWDATTADIYSNKRKQFEKEQQQIKDNAEKERLKKLDNDLTNKLYNGTLSKENIDAAKSEGLDPKRAITLKNALEEIKKAEEKAKEAQKNKDEKALQEAQKDFEKQIDLLLKDGYSITQGQVNKYYEEKKISESAFHRYSSLVEKEDTQKKQAREAERKAQQKALEAQQKADHEKELYEQAKKLAEAYQYALHLSGQGLKLIDDMDIPESDRKILREYYNNFISTQRQVEKDKKAIHEEIQEALWNNIFYGLVSNESNFTREDFNLMYSKGEITKEQYNEGISILDARKREEERAQNEIWEANMQAIADGLFDKFGVEGLEEAYKEINSLPDVKNRDEVTKRFNRRLAEARSIENQKERELANRQRENYLKYSDEYIRNFKQVPNDILEQARRDRHLSDSQIEELQSLNGIITTREGVEKILRENVRGFNAMPYNEQQRMISHALGVSDEARQENLSKLVELAASGLLETPRIDSAAAAGYIWPDDAARVRDYNKELRQEYKTTLNENYKQILGVINELMIAPTYKTALRNAATRTLLEYRNNNKQDKNLDEQATNLYNTLLNAVIKKAQELNIPLIQWDYLPYPHRAPTRTGRIFNQVREAGPILSPYEQTIPYQTASGIFRTVDQFGNNKQWTGETEIPLPPQPLSSIVQPAPSYNNNTAYKTFIGGIVGNDKFKISGGFSTQGSKLRNWRPHLAIDIPLSENTPLKTPVTGTIWNVVKVGENDTAGKFVKIETTLPDNQNKLSITLAHMNSHNVSEGDEIEGEWVLGYSGNTGNSTGPHVHISMKLNGEAIDPTKFDLNQYGIDNFRLNSADLSPYGEPVRVSTDQEQFAYMDSIMFSGDNNNIVRNSADYGGY